MAEAQRLILLRREPALAGKEFGVFFFAFVSLDKQRNEVDVRGRNPATLSLSLDF